MINQCLLVGTLLTMSFRSFNIHGFTFDEYLRVSVDNSKREKSNDEQHDENGAFVADHDARIGRTYSDVGSASNFARKPRGDFGKLIDDLRHRRFNGNGLIVWEVSRGSRRVDEWTTLFTLLAEQHKLIAVPSLDNVFDPADDFDYDALMRLVLDAKLESAKTSKRIRRGVNAMAPKGHPHGRAPYGYRAVYENKTVLGWVPEPDEKAVLVDAFERIAAGESLRSVARVMAGHGVVGRNGRPMTAETLRPMLLSDTYRGVRVHAPGSKSRHDRKGTVHHYDGKWDALVSDELFYAVKSRLTDPARKTTRPGRGVHLLSMIGKCDVCDGPIAARNRDAERRYVCHRASHVLVGADALDQYVEQNMLVWLTRPENVERLTAGDGDNDALADARDAQARIRAELADLVEQVGSGALSATFAALAEPKIQQRLDAATRRVEELATPSSLRGLIDPAGDVTAQWQRAPMPVKREIARRLLSVDMMGELRVIRAPTTGRVTPADERVEFQRN